MTSSSSLQCFGDCLDESNMEDPEIHIGSVGDLLKVFLNFLNSKILKTSFSYVSKKKLKNDNERQIVP